MYVLLAISVLLILLAIWIVRPTENFTPFYLDQMAMKNSDPMAFKYASWERDANGISSRDYYLENQTNYLNKVAPGYFEGDRLYKAADCQCGI